jgi:hypothetical protein
MREQQSEQLAAGVAGRARDRGADHREALAPRPRRAAIIDWRNMPFVVISNPTRKGAVVKKTRGCLLIALLALMLMGCPEKKEGPLEEAGEKLDNATDEVKDAVEDAADEVEDAVDDLDK